MNILSIVSTVAWYASVKGRFIFPQVLMSDGAEVSGGQHLGSDCKH